MVWEAQVKTTCAADSRSLQQQRSAGVRTRRNGPSQAAGQARRVGQGLGQRRPGSQRRGARERDPDPEATCCPSDGGPHGDGAFVSLKMEDSATCGNTGEPGGRHMEGNPPGQERRGSPRASTAAIRIRSEGSKRHRPSLSPLRPGGRLRHPSALVKSGLSGRIPGDRRVHTQQPREARGARRPQT